MKKLIFFSNVGPERETAAWTPFRLAHRALDAGLDVEVFLSGAACALLRRDVRERLEGRPRVSLQAVLDGEVPISAAPG